MSAVQFFFEWVSSGFLDFFGWFSFWYSLSWSSPLFFQTCLYSDSEPILCFGSLGLCEDRWHLFDLKEGLWNQIRSHWIFFLTEEPFFSSLWTSQRICVRVSLSIHERNEIWNFWQRFFPGSCSNSFQNPRNSSLEFSFAF